MTTDDNLMQYSNHRTDPILYDEDGNAVPHPNGHPSQLLYPYIRNPMFAYKYFEYVSNGATPSDPLIHGIDILNYSMCYLELPIDPEDLCEPLKCSGTGAEWGCAERLTFYEAISTYKELKDPDIDADGTNPGEEIQCPQYNSGLNSTDITNIENYSGTSPLSTSSGNDLLNSMVVDLQELFVDMSVEIGNDEMHNDGLDNEHGGWLSSGTDPSYMDFKLLEMKGKCNDNCESRRADITNAVTTMFLNNCYQIGGCPENDNVVTLVEIDEIVNEIINDCKASCAQVPSEAGYPTCVEQSCYMMTTDGTGNPAGFVEIHDVPMLELAPECDVELLKQIRTWVFEVNLENIKSKCEDENGDPIVRSNSVWWNNTANCANGIANDPVDEFSGSRQVDVTTND